MRFQQKAKYKVWHLKLVVLHSNAFTLSDSLYWLHCMGSKTWIWVKFKKCMTTFEPTFQLVCILSDSYYTHRAMVFYLLFLLMEVWVWIWRNTSLSCTGTSNYETLSSWELQSCFKCNMKIPWQMHTWTILQLDYYTIWKVFFQLTPIWIFSSFFLQCQILT